MKLKKIVSLALAGVLAVSMLAGCAEGTKPVEKPTTDTTSDSSIVSIVNTAIAGNKAGISYTADADFTNAVKKVVTEKGTDSSAIETALKTELDITTKTNFAVANLNPGTNTDGTTYNSFAIYVYEGKKETALSAAYKAASEIGAVVNGLVADKAETGNLVEYTYSDANVVMLEMTAADTNYYVVVARLTCDVEKES